jgi:hypothetical protein
VGSTRVFLTPGPSPRKGEGGRRKVITLIDYPIKRGKITPMQKISNVNELI